MANPNNIIPPKHGEPSRNPNGRPKGSRNRATIYRDIAEMGVEALKIHADHLPKGIDVATATAIAMFRKAILDGDVAAAREAFDSAFGKVTDRIDHTSDGQPLNVAISFVAPNAPENK